MSSSYYNYIMEIMHSFGGITSRSMFGGYGLYKNGIIFAIIANDELYFKADDSNILTYKQFGSEPFLHESRGRKISMSYWKVPMEILEDEEELKIWVEKSYQISLKNKKIR
jgi:DNA transformation protein and related proteins